MATGRKLAHTDKKVNGMYRFHSRVKGYGKKVSNKAIRRAGKKEIKS